MILKWNKTTRSRIAGLVGIILGFYILLKLQNKWGILAISLGLLLLLWKYR